VVLQAVSESQWQEVETASPVAYGETCEACEVVVVVAVAYEVAS
jgi:hypothetical protein